jgi:hypothetical protein
MSADLFGAETRPRRAMGSHQSGSGGSDEWLTAPAVLDALGPFDLDPCAPINRPWPTAATHYTIEDDGLRQPWAGRVWLNPPYAKSGPWLHRLADHGQGTALIFARTETALWFRHVWPRASALLFIQGRLYFYRTNGTRSRANSGAPSVLVAYGSDDAERLRIAPLAGKFVAL